MSNAQGVLRTRAYPIAGVDQAIRWVRETVSTEGVREIRPIANDDLYDILEQRHGGGFAQWVIDRLPLQEVRS